MAINCVNKGHKDVIKLAEEFKLSTSATAAIISVWQDVNNTLDTFPTIEEFKNELNIEDQVVQTVDTIKNKDFERKLAELNETSQITLKQAIEEQPDIKRNKVFTETNKKLKVFLERLGVDVKSVDTIKDSNGELIDAVSKADIINKIIEVVENKRDFTTLPEESAHFFVELLGVNNPLYKSMMDKITTFKIYDEVLSEYADVYGDDIDKYKKEAIAKLISINILNELPLSEETLSRQSVFKRWFNLAWSALKNIFSNASSKDISPFIQSAKNILEGKIDNLLDVGDVIDEAASKGTNLTFYQLSSEAIEKREEVIKSLHKKELVRTEGGYETLDGKKVKDRVSNYVQKFYSKLFRNSKQPSKILANKSVYVHKLNKLLMAELIDGKSIDELKANKENIANISVNELSIENPEFANLLQTNKSFFNISDEQFSELVEGISALYQQILNNNNKINKALDTNFKPEIFTELSLYSEVEDLAGTVDIVVIYPNGAAAVYDYKGKSFKRISREENLYAPIPDYEIQAGDIKLGQYKRLLKEQYGIKEFAESRLIPINIQLKIQKGKHLEEGFHKIEFGNTSDRRYLNQIPVAKELTNDTELDKSLNKLLSLRDNLRARKRTDFNNPQLELKFKKIDASIKNIQLNRDVSYVYNEMRFLKDDFTARSLLDSESPDYLTLSDIVDYNEYVSVYKDFANDSMTQIRKNKDLSLAKRMKEMAFDMIELEKEITKKLIERVNIIDDFDITDEVVQTGQLGKLFKQLRDFDQPAFKKLAKLVRDNYELKREQINELIETVTEKDSAVGKWANEKDLSKFEAFKKLLNDKRNLISKFDKSYYKDFNKAREEKNTNWIIKNTNFDIEKFTKHKDKYFNYLDSVYTASKLTELENELTTKLESLSDLEKDDLKGQISSLKQNEELKNTLKLDWERKYDHIAHPSAYYNKGNYYLQLKDNPTKYNDSWKFLIQKGNEPLREYYDMYVQYNEEFNEIANKKVNKNFIQEIRQDMLDRMVQSGLGLGDLRLNLLHSLETRQFDISEREIDPNTGKPYPIVPLFGTDKLRDNLSSREVKEIQENILKEGIKEDSTIYKIELEKRILAKEYEKGIDFKSIDLSRSLVLFGENVYVNQAMTESEDTVRAIQSLLHSGVANTQLTDSTGTRMIDKIKGVAAKLIGIPSSDIDTFDKFVDLYWYGLNTQNKDLTHTVGTKYHSDGTIQSEGKTYSGNKLARMIMNYTSLNALAFKPILAAGNALGILTNSYMMGAEGIHYTKEQMNKAWKLLIKKDDISIAADQFFEPSARNLTYEKANDLSASKVTQLFTMITMFLFHKKPDDIMDRNILMAMMFNHGIEDGKIKKLNKIEGTDKKSLYDLSYIKNDKFNIKGLEGNKEEYIKFRSKVRSVATKIKGSISEDNKNLIGTNTLGAAIMQFKNWIPGLASARFSKLKYDIETDEVDIGRFRVFAGELTQASGLKEKIKTFGRLSGEIALSLPVINSLGKRGTIFNKARQSKAASIYYKKFLADNPNIKKSEFTLEDFMDLRVAKLKGLAQELSMLLSFFGLVMLLKSSVPEDDGDNRISRVVMKNLYKSVNRGLLEISFWFDPESVSSFISSPVPAFRTITNLRKLLANTLDVTFDAFLEEGHPKRAILKKSQKDKKPLFYYSSNAIPVISSGVELFDLFDKPLPQ